jgi:hypothetical protein
MPTESQIIRLTRGVIIAFAHVSRFPEVTEPERYNALSLRKYRPGRQQTDSLRSAPLLRPIRLSKPPA